MLFSRATSVEFQLKLLEKSDAGPLFETINTNRAYIRQWLPWVDSTHNLQDSKAFVDDCLTKYTRGESVVNGIWCDGQMVGCIGINDITRFHQKASLGYWLAKNYQEKGIITRACRQLIDYSFNDLRLNRMEILCAVKNYKSRAVAQRLRFAQEGVLRDYFRLHNNYVDVVIYSMLRSDWKRL
jgi:ribosomal-protein-serine acetyltransferase